MGIRRLTEERIGRIDKGIRKMPIRITGHRDHGARQNGVCLLHL